MADVSEQTGSPTESGVEQRFDLFAAMVGVADAWWQSMPAGDEPEPETARRAFAAIAELAAMEVLP